VRPPASTFRVRVEASGARGAAMVVARAFQLPLEAARRLLAEPRVLPRELDEAEAERLVVALRRQGVTCERVPVVGHASAVCGAHPSLSAELPCEECRALVCVLCQGREGRALCERCSARRVRRARAKALRVAVLLGVLVGLVLWGVSRQRARDRRLAWERPLEVAVVLLARGEVTPGVREAWEEGLGRLQDWAAREAGRYRADLRQPVRFVLVGPVSGGDFRFEAPEDTAWARLRQAHRWSTALAAVDEEAGVSSRPWDARIYVLLEDVEQGESRLVEGLAEAGGTRGLVRGVRGDTALTLELTAVAHELFHCLGAADAYDAEGHARVPEGLVEPGREPLYPQPAAEVMVGEVPLGEAQGRLPDSLEEVGVGPTTAKALRWAW
jgi:hypothetical protein